MEDETLTFSVDRITYHNEDNGYCVLKGTSKDGSKVAVVGSLGKVQTGEEIKAQGTWIYHPTYGAQFQVTKYMLLKPATLKGIEKFLGSGMIKGIGPVTAKNLVDRFGLDTLEIIEKHPEKLAECPGIGANKADIISKGWFLQRSVQEIMVFLQGYGVSPVYAVRIHKHYDKDTIKIVSQNPYILAYEIPGMGFKKADAIAAELGIKGDDKRRVEAGILYILDNITKDGHLFLTENELYKYSEQVLNIKNEKIIKDCVEKLNNEKRIITTDYLGNRLCYLKDNYNAEKSCVELIKSFLEQKRTVNREKLISIFDKIQDNGFVLSDIQQYAVEASLSKSFMIITGGPGTGKTTTLKTVVAAHKALGRKVLLASPTGRAAKRLSEVSGYNAVTIHRLLEYSHAEHGFYYNFDNKLDCDSIIIDEASMIDMGLFYSLISAVPIMATIILVGDADQLPSVGPGSVLNELINSQVVPVVKLDKIFRQAESSDIIKNAHLINSGNLPKLIVPDGKTDTDCYFVKAENDNRVLSLLKNIIKVGMPKKFGFNPINDIQVITPMNRGPLGAIKLNNVLQEILNPPQDGKGEIHHLDRIFRTGDKVIQLKNNYDLDVFNGDIGIICNVNAEDQEVIVEFPQGKIVLHPEDMVDLALAYAITVHKSQGSEYPCVVFITSTQHFVMLQRNLLYTGLTRAKKAMVLLGSLKAIDIAVKNEKIRHRNTILGKLLNEAIND